MRKRNWGTYRSVTFRAVADGVPQGVFEDHPPPKQRPARTRKPGEIDRLLKLALSKPLNGWDQRFVMSLVSFYARRDKLSAKQTRALKRLIRRYAGKPKRAWNASVRSETLPAASRDCYAPSLE